MAAVLAGSNVMAQSTPAPKVMGNVYGGGNLATVGGSVTVNMRAGTVEKDVYGGGALANTNINNVAAASYNGTGTETGNTFANTTTVNLTGGTIKGDAYGGGLGQLGTPVEGVKYTQEEANTYNSEHNLSEDDAGYKTTDDWKVEPVAAADANDAVKALVYGNVTVNLGSDGGSSATAFHVTNYSDEHHSGVVKSGRVFGCNNLNGYPLGNVTVEVWKTVEGNVTRTEEDPNNTGAPKKGDNITPSYEVAAVYGGGNLANKSGNIKTQVVIETCDVSIRDVYGGGNAAAVPETDVLVKGAYEIQEVFGGGNGKDPYTLDNTQWTDNPGANVNGNANTLLTGGYIHEAYGGSNEKGTITGNVNIDVGTEGCACDLDVEKMVGAGKNADVNGNLIMILGCKPDNVKIPLLYAGADNANVNGNVELTITSGKFGKVFGGNNESGAIRGHIKLNIEETGDCDTPIEIDELYLGGNLAAYSKYGYYIKTTNENGTGDPEETADLDDNGRLQFMPRTSASDSHMPVKEYNRADNSWTVYTGNTGDVFSEYAEPVLNVVSCTRIGRVFGGGLGETAIMCANPTVNINMIPGKHASGVPAVMTDLGLTPADNPDNLGIIGDVFGGGNAADVYGNTTVNIGTEARVQLHESVDANGTYTMSANQNVKGAFIMGNVFGGGNEADIKKNTEVNVSATKTVSGQTVTFTNRDFTTTNATGVRVLGSVYGGGNLGSVGDFTTTSVTGHTAHSGCIGKPSSLKTSDTGKCTVNVGGYAEIGPNNMQMNKVDGEGNPLTDENGDPLPPDDTGYIFGASRGEVKDPAVDPDIDFRTYVYETDLTVGGHAFIKGSVYGGSENGRVLNDTYVKIQESCQIGNGYVQMDNNGIYLDELATPETPMSVNRRYTDAEWAAGNLIPDQTKEPELYALVHEKYYTSSLPECASWKYKNPYKPYDKHGTAHGGDVNATDGHTFYGNVFGGGSGLFAYEGANGGHGDWLRTAGRVEGNTHVEITGGYILTNVYGGCELTDVGNGLEVESGKGMCFVKMSGGTLGVPRTLEQIAAHPVTCYLFGAGKGDQRVRFNQWTNVGSVDVEVSGTAKIYGSIFGGGEDGHVLGDVKVEVKNGADVGTGANAVRYPYIGTWGTSYVDGNVFGGGRGFGGDALTAGVVCGNITMNISDGTMLGSIYGGGRLGSVGTYLVPSNNSNYGKLIPDGKKQKIVEGASVQEGDDASATHGEITISISGGTIGNSHEYLYVAPSDNANLATLKTNNHIPNTDFEDYTASDGTVYKRLKHTKGGNVFAGAMGRLKALDNTTLDHWPDLGKAKKTVLNISSSAIIKSNVYGGGELGTLEEGSTINIDGGTIGTIITNKEDNVDVAKYTFGSVFGGGAGSAEDIDGTSVNNGRVNTKDYAGLVKGSTSITMSAGTVLASVYGGGELAIVAGSHTTTGSDSKTVGTEINISGTAIVGHNQDGFGGATMGNVYGGGKGSLDTQQAGLVKNNTLMNISGGNIYHNIYGGGAYGSVGTYTLDNVANNSIPDDTPVSCTSGGTAWINITGGTIGINGHENGMVFGSSRGDVAAPDASGEDPNNKLAWVNETYVTIGTTGEGTAAPQPQIKGSVYGSGENGHVLNDTHVAIHSGTIGIETGDPINGLSGASYGTRGNVYGGGCGTDTYTADGATYFNRSAGIVRGNTNITMDGGYVVRSIYGGGAMGSVGTFTRNNNAIGDHVPGTIASCADNTGLCTVTISGGEVGPDDMQMPMNAGMVFGAGRGEVQNTTDYPNLERMVYVNNTDVTISGTAFVKGSVYGGSESGHVLNDTHVTIADECQIGNGWDPTLNSGAGGGINKRYTEYATYTTWPTETEDIPTSWAECNHWTMDTATGGMPYDPNAIYSREETEGEGDAATTVTKYYYDPGFNHYAEGGCSVATDGHTFYGNVFGGGSGREPYAPGLWLRSAGSVGGNTVVDITGGHILTSAYGGNEMTNVDGSCTVNMVGGTLGVPRTEADARAHLVTCYLFGAGKGDARKLFNGWTNVASTEVNVSGNARIYGSTFGGGEDGHVLGNAVTNIGKSVTIGTTTYTQPTTTSTDQPGVIIGTTGTSTGDGNIFGGGRGYSQTALTAGVVCGDVKVNFGGGKILANIYGGGRLASVGTYLVSESETGRYGFLIPDGKEQVIGGEDVTVEGKTHGNIQINITNGTIKGSVYGGCMGVAGSEEMLRKFGKSRTTEVNFSNGTILGSVYGGNHNGGAVENTATLNITGGIMGSQTNINVGTKASVFGGGYGYDTAVLGNVKINIGSDNEESLKIGLSPNIYGDVYGGSALGDVNGWQHLGATYNAQYTNSSTTKVNLFGGIVHGDAYGGGLGNSTTPAYVYGPVTVTLNGTAFDPTNHPTRKNDDNTPIPISGRIFGCNNINGSPKSTVLVHVKQTVGVTKENNIITGTTTTKSIGNFDMQAVYGGGNMAAYEPDISNVETTGQYTTNHNANKNPLQVVIDGCTNTSIDYVYGGGNAASVTSTDVLVLGAYEIDDLFGGGNGKDKVPENKDDANGTYITNPGANVGLRAYPDADNHAYSTKEERATNYGYGTGKAHATIYGGKVNAVYGGSNTKGNIRVEARATLEDVDGGCNFNVGEAFGGGRNAPMDGDAVLDIGCISGLGKAFGGAAEADVNGDVILNITNGTYGQVFGGNDIGGAIRGSIVVNIEETGCRPIIIGQLYAGGNQAAYSVYGYDADGNPLKKGDAGAASTPVASPQLNVKSFTSIGDIFGGGYGSGATMVGDPTVNVNVVEGKYANTDSGSNSSIVNDNARVVESSVVYSGTGYDTGFPIPSHAKGKIGAINNVFGGGNAAAVIGNPTVNIGTEAGDVVYEVVTVAVGDDVAGYYTRTGEGTIASPYEYSETPLAAGSKAVAGTVYCQKKTKSVDIRGNVYGGGNNAPVTGNTNVVIGKDGNPTP